jgi:ribosomal protein S18 acetylase RimI-like enzyme
MRFRLASLADAALIADLHTRSWQQAYRGILTDTYLNGPIAAERAVVWHERLSNPPANQWVVLAEENGQAVGFICLYLDHDPALGTLVDNLHVEPGLKGQGIGAQLLQKGANVAATYASRPCFHLYVLARNQRAVGFYDRMAGQRVNHETHHTPDGGRHPVYCYAWEKI